jgi:hypothetical protein
LAALLHHVLHQSDLHVEAAELIAVIADDGLPLYYDFDQAELGGFLQSIAKCTALLAKTTIKRGQAIHACPAKVLDENAVDKWTRPGLFSSCAKWAGCRFCEVV